MSSKIAILSGLLTIVPLAGFAKPLVTSSEDNLARVCLARVEAPDRLVRACDAALMDARLTQSQRAELIVARADGYLWQSHYDKAVEDYRTATNINALSVDAWNGLGWALWELNDDQGALEAFEQSLVIEASVQGLGGKAALARRLGIIDNIEARALLGAALAIDPDYIWAVRELAWSHFEDGQFAEALAQFEEALDIEPRDVNARYGMGRSLVSQGNPEEALAWFNDILLDAPDDFGAMVYRIIALRDLDRNAQALRFSDRLIEAYPERATGYIQKAKSLMGLERRQDAIDTYVAAEELVGPDNALLYWHADTLTEDGQFEAALAVIERAVGLDGADHSDHLLKSYIALALKDYSLARSAAEASLAMGSQDPWAHYYIAITLIHEGDTENGMRRFDLAIQSGLPADRIGAFASELVDAGRYFEAAQLRLKY